jgi:hypothetical protein
VYVFQKSLAQGIHLLPEAEREFYIDRYRIKRKGGVLYLLLEGKGAFHLRLQTLLEVTLSKQQMKFEAGKPVGEQMKFGDRSVVPFAWNTYRPNLFERGPDDLIRLAEREAAYMRREFGVDLVAVMLDTMGLAACYESEDKSAQVQKVVSGLYRLSDATGALAIGIDHFGKDQALGLRGSSAKRDTPETLLACLADRTLEGRATNHRMVLHKLRDGTYEGRVVPYRLDQIDLGYDEDGDPVSTCVVVWEPDRKPPKEEKRSSAQATLKEVLTEVLNQHSGGIKPNGKDAAVHAVDLTETEEAAEVEQGRTDEDALMAVMAGAEPKAEPMSIAEMAVAVGWTLANEEGNRSKVQRVLKRLEKDKLVKNERGKWRLAGRSENQAKAETGTKTAGAGVGAEATGAKPDAKDETTAGAKPEDETEPGTETAARRRD